MEVRKRVNTETKMEIFPSGDEVQRMALLRLACTKEEAFMTL